MKVDVFSSKIDTWLLVVLVGAAVVGMVGAGAAISRDARALPVALFILFVGVVLPLWILSSTRYALDDVHLIIRSGPFRWRVPIAEITSVTPTRNPLSSPALSLDRLRIEYGRGRAVMISPADKDSFLHALESRRRVAVKRHAGADA